jgi:hypothetical protein
MAVALFVGFIFLTKWTGDDPDSVDSLGDQDLSSLQSFCFAINSSFVSYDMVLAGAAGMATGDGGFSFDSPATRDLAEGFLTNLIEDLPNKYTDNGSIAIEGLERALDGDLDPDDVPRYVDAYEELQADSAADCNEAGIPPYVDGGSFDNGSFGDIDTETTVP